MSFAPDQQLNLRVDDLTWREVHDELLVLDMNTATYLTLNGSAKFLWEKLVDGATPALLGGSLVERYGISQERADADVASFLDVLEERSFLEAID